MSAQELTLEKIISFLFFPLFFQGDLLQFAWGSDDVPWIMIVKRIFVILPTVAFLAVCWLSIISLLTVVIRQERRKYSTYLFMGWWDLGRAILTFWGGFFKFFWLLFNTLFMMSRLVVFAAWGMFQDIIFFPFRMVKSVSAAMLSPGVPWIAVCLTVIWCLIEATIFTYVTTPLVMDTLSNLTGEALTEEFVRIPLFLFMLFLILGSYAVLSAWTDAIKSRSFATILKIGLIEIVAAMVEVVFLYREFVDSLVPWFAQHSGGDFQLGIAGILTIAGFAWLGIRGMSWFLFGSAGTPMILSVIQGSGVSIPGREFHISGKSAMISTNLLFDQLKRDSAWFSQKGEELLDAFILPPMQILAVVINFAVLLLAARPLFVVPLKSIREIGNSKEMINSLKIDSAS